MTNTFVQLTNTDKKEKNCQKATLTEENKVGYSTQAFDNLAHGVIVNTNAGAASVSHSLIDAVNGR